MDVEKGHQICALSIALPSEERAKSPELSEYCFRSGTRVNISSPTTKLFRASMTNSVDTIAAVPILTKAKP